MPLDGKTIPQQCATSIYVSARCDTLRNEFDCKVDEDHVFVSYAHGPRPKRQPTAAADIGTRSALTMSLRLRPYGFHSRVRVRCSKNAKGLFLPDGIGFSIVFGPLFGCTNSGGRDVRDFPTDQRILLQLTESCKPLFPVRRSAT